MSRIHKKSFYKEEGKGYNNPGSTFTDKQKLQQKEKI